MGGKSLLYFEPAFLFIMATEQTQKMITVTAKAAEKIQEFMKEEAEAPEYLRVCSRWRLFRSILWDGL